MPVSTTQLCSFNSVQPDDQLDSDILEAQVLATSASNKVLLTSWQLVKTAGISDPLYSTLLHVVQSDEHTWPDEVKEYKRFQKDLTSVDSVVLYKGRVVIPPVLRQNVLRSLHQAHQGPSTMALRTHESVWWPGITDDLSKLRSSCQTCHKMAPSQSPMPPVHPPLPEYPFQLISSDYFALEGHTYLIIVDRYSNWPVVRKCKTETSAELISALREFFCTYGVPDQLATDGGSNYMAQQTQDFLKAWGVNHRVSSAYHPHSNLRAETAVKTIKRLISDNIDRSGNLDNDSMAAALLSYRNTPDRDTGRSSSMILYARQMKDTIPCHPNKLKLRPEWIFTADQ